MTDQEEIKSCVWVRHHADAGIVYAVHQGEQNAKRAGMDEDAAKRVLDILGAKGINATHHNCFTYEMNANGRGLDEGVFLVRIAPTSVTKFLRDFDISLKQPGHKDKVDFGKGITPPKPAALPGK